MPTKIELTLEQSQQGVSNDVLMIVDIEDDIMDPVMQCTTLPSHLSFSQKKLVSFVTEIHTDIAQKEELGFEESFAPVVGWKLFVCSFAYAAQKSFYVLPKGRFKTAFLYGPLKEEVINQSPRGIFINQAKYAQEILKKHGMTSCDSIGTPMATKHLDADLSAKSTEKHLTAVKRIFRYLKDSINMGLWYPKDTGFELTAFSDSDHAGCLDSRKSTSGGIQFLGGDKLVSWSSKKQDCTSMSSAEAEYAAIAISCNPVHNSRTKHIDVRYHFIKEQVEKGIVELFFVGTEYQLADLFTKALSEYRFKYLVRRLGMRCLTPDELEILPEHLSDTQVFTVKMEILLEPTSNKLLVGKTIDSLLPLLYALRRSGNENLARRAQVDQGSQIKMIQVKEMMQDNDLKNLKSKDKGSKSRSQSMDEQSHYKQDKTITRQSINVKRHIFNVIGGSKEFEERDLNIGGDC
ncbi:hypothetical protein Tco_1042575 [Tanacetum coccineum]|uniref:Retrovirus-related Pol polyprotein from transposon TNT 1-94 n=1 Tax=Tanacetum coccineum TaxID=301880 RepID=A0ABQ5GK51_9ASTR